MSRSNDTDTNKMEAEEEQEQEQEQEEHTGMGTEEPKESESNAYNLSSLIEYLRKLNEYLDQEEEYDRFNRKIRRIIFKHNLLNKNLIGIYKFLLSKINSPTQKEIFLNNSSLLLENHKELISNLKLIKTLNELLKLLVDLTSPSEVFFINHNLIFLILNKFELIVKHGLVQLDTPNFLEEILITNETEPNLNETIDLSTQKFKESLIESNLFVDICLSMNNLTEYYKSMSLEVHLNKHNMNLSHAHIKHFKLLTNILFDSLVLNLALVRNLTFEKNDSKLSVLINRMFDAKLDEFLLSLSNLSKLNKSFQDNKKYEQRSFVTYSILIQIMSLIFSKLNNLQLISQNVNQVESTFSSSSAQSNQSDLMMENKKSKSNLNSLARRLCLTGSFANLVEQMLKLLTKPVDLYVYFDLSYFLWFLKFFIQNFVLKQIKLTSTNKSDENMDTNLEINNTTTTNNNKTSEGFNFDYIKNRLSKKSITEKSFINDFKLEEAKQTKKVLLNFDLFSYVIFLILENFEQLIFDSNLKNMNLLKLFHLKKSCSKEENTLVPPAKMTNINSLTLLCLSMNCLHELIDCVNHHLEYLNSFKLNQLTDQHLSQDLAQEDFLIFLNEILNFDELKQLFPLLMRFYCYNQHVYSNNLIKTIFLTNQLFLNTFKHVHELIRLIKLKEQEKEIMELHSDTNATKNSSTVSSFTMKPLNLNEIYNMYANTDTSFILKHVLTQFVHNEPTLNRCVIDLLDTLMCESDRHEYLFHMNFALALANIATLDNYRLLDQRTKDLVSNMLCGLRRLCKRRPNLANKILFDIHYSADKLSDQTGEDELYKTRSHKRIKLDTSESDPFLDSDSFSQSKYSTTSSSWSSLKSTTTISPSSAESKNKNDSDNSKKENSTKITELTKDLKLLIENEFLYCIRSLDVFNKKNFSSKKLDATKLCNFITKNDHLYRIFSYLVGLFEATNNSEIKPNSWQIYNCLLNMKFNMNDKINYLNELNTCYSSGSNFSLGINLGFGPYKNDFFKSKECINLRQACSTEEFRKQLKEAYIKYLIEKLSLKSRRTKNAIFWIFNILKGIKLYLTKRSFYLNKNTNDLNQFNLATHTSGAHAGMTGYNTTMLLITSSSSLFQMKLIDFYHCYNLGIPFIPYTFELQQVFHSVDFSHLLDILGIVRTNRGFPFIPPDWLDNNRIKLNECLSVMEKCLCI